MIFWHPCGPRMSSQWKTVRQISQMISGHLMGGCWRVMSLNYNSIFPRYWVFCLCIWQLCVPFWNVKLWNFMLALNCMTKTAQRGLVEWQGWYKQLYPLGGALTSLGEVETKVPYLTQQATLENHPLTYAHLWFHIPYTILMHMCIFSFLYFNSHCSSAGKT